MLSGELFYFPLIPCTYMLKNILETISAFLASFESIFILVRLIIRLLQE